MCSCGTANVNGTLGYRWQPNDSPGVRECNPPQLLEKERLLYDEPGRCGGMDSHSHHYRVVQLYSSLFLVVRHGGGDERIRLDNVLGARLSAMDSTTRYWVLNALIHAHKAGEYKAQEKEAAKWRQAAAEKRIRTRKQRGAGVKVWIESEAEMLQRFLTKRSQP